MRPMASVKGSTLRTRRTFVLRHHGEEAWRRVLGALPAEMAAECDSLLVASRWYPFALRNALEAAIVRVCAAGDEKICVDMGAFSASENLSTLYRQFRAGGDEPGPFYRRFAQLYPALYDFGRMGVVESAEENVVRIVHDFDGNATRTNCLGTIGFFRGAGQAAGIPGVVVEERGCQVRGDTSCVLLVRWGGRRKSRPIPAVGG